MTRGRARLALVGSLLALGALACGETAQSNNGAELGCQVADCDLDSSRVDLDLAVGDALEPDLSDALPPTITLTLHVQSYGAAFLAPNWARERTSWGFPHYQSVDRALSDDTASPEPAPGARVALDDADGKRLGEAVSDADGHVVFELAGDPWPVSATAYKAGYPLHTVAAIDRPANDASIPLTICSPWREPEDMVRIGGMTRRIHPNNYLFINVLTPYADWSSLQSNSWSLETPAGAPFDLIAVEMTFADRADGFTQEAHRIAYVASDGVDTDTPLTVDFGADGVEWTPLTGTFELPRRAQSPLRQGLVEPAARVLAQTGSVWSGIVGWPTSLLRDGRVAEYEIALAETPGLDSTFYEYWVQSDSGWSMAWGRGNSAEPQPTLLDLPSWVSASQGGLGAPVDEPLRWALYDEAVKPRILIRNDADVRWVVVLRDDATEVVLPAPPSEVDLDTLLGPAPTATIALERPIDSLEGVFWMASWGPRLRLDLAAWQEGGL